MDGKVSPARVTYHKMTPDIDQGTIRFEVDVTDQALGKKLICQVSLKGQDIVAAEVELLENQTVFDLSLRSKEMPFTLKLWWPHDPVLYDVVLKIVDDQSGNRVLDEAKTYFGMRKIETANGQVLLNNIPLYQRLILDQGYWKDSHLTPPSEEAMVKDIEIIKEAGYNGLRKHEKVEDPRFHYLCDKMGMLLWCEMPSTYVFNDDAISNFSREWVEIVRQNYNHPSIITWTVINESWGVPEIYTDRHQQLFTEGMYYLTKSIDPMRLVLVNEGWEHTVSDIVGLHDYHEWGDYITETYADKEVIVTNKIPFNGGKYAMAKGYEYKGQPVMNTEYGGIAFADESGWGYGRQVASEEEFIKRFDSLTTAFKKLPYNMGYCFTQVTDVQQEINGLWDIDRNPKVDIAKIREINLRKV